jgi:hypothetical protein
MRLVVVVANRLSFIRSDSPRSWKCDNWFSLFLPPSFTCFQINRWNVVNTPGYDSIVCHDVESPI